MEERYRPHFSGLEVFTLRGYPTENNYFFLFEGQCGDSNGMPPLG